MGEPSPDPTTLALEIVEAVLDGGHPAAMTVTKLMGPFPVEWKAQRHEFGPA